MLSSSVQTLQVLHGLCLQHLLLDGDEGAGASGMPLEGCDDAGGWFEDAGTTSGWEQPGH